MEAKKPKRKHKKHKKHKPHTRISYAKTDVACLICGKILKAGERTPSQELCSTGRKSKTLSRCQQIHYNKKKQELKQSRIANYIMCDQCGKKIRKEMPLQLRCMSDTEELSPCQTKAKSKSMRDAAKKRDEARRVAIAGRTTRSCLKCSRDFQSEGNYDRICEPCDQANARTYVATEHGIRHMLGTSEMYSS